jgi:hypothetical protein
MRRTIGWAVVTFFLALPVAGLAQQQGQSVADAARKAREQKKNEPKTAKVFTNDNIPTSGAVSTVGGQPVAPGGAAGATAAGIETPAGPAVKAEQGEKKDEAYWRKKFSEARTKLAQDQKELDILQRELNNLLMQYYPDPNKGLAQQLSRGDNDARQKIADKQKEVEQDKQALSDLEDELRRSGGPPGWSSEQP